ncbi:MAG: GNAT family N-acetyltransferase [Bacteroidetes bacterium]|nr:GNAT family N-acetyltransferase [Bacteroidota bacterium]
MRIVTDRLQLENTALTHAPFYYELFNSEGWLQYIGNRNINSIKDAETYLAEKQIPLFKKHGYGNCTVFLKDSKIPIGSCGLYKREQLEHPDIGFAFLPEFIGKGYGYEAAHAMMEYAKKDLNITKIFGFTVDYNHASIALLTKLGFQEKGTFTFEDDPEELLLFSTK